MTKERYNELLKEYHQACIDAEEYCEMVGKPSHGADYDLMCSNALDEFERSLKEEGYYDD